MSPLKHKMSQIEITTGGTSKKQLFSRESDIAKHLRVSLIFYYGKPTIATMAATSTSTTQTSTSIVAMLVVGAIIWRRCKGLWRWNTCQNQSRLSLSVQLSIVTVTVRITN